MDAATKQELDGDDRVLEQIFKGERLSLQILLLPEAFLEIEFPGMNFESYGDGIA